MKKSEGFVLIFVLVVVSLLLLVSATFQLIVSNDLSLAKTSSDSVRAYHIAEAGIAKKFMELRSGNTGAITNESFSLADGNSGTFSATATLTQIPPLSKYRIDSTGRYKNAARGIILDVKQVSFSRYAYFSNSENQLLWFRRPIWFITGDRITGPLHTNDQIHISGDPVFEGPVSSVNSALDFYHGNPSNEYDNPVFEESLNLGVPAVAFPTSAGMINDLRSAAQSGGLHLTGDTAVTLLPNGTMYVTNEANDWENELVGLPANHALFVDDGNLSISGILDGQLTAGTGHVAGGITTNIIITGDLLYNTDPRTGSSTDVLGLVSQNNVIISSGAPFDIEVDAYIVALSSSFTVANYWSGLKGTLTIYGGITQWVRGPIGTFDPSTNEKASGYTKDYHYDERLADTAPAYFPAATDSDNRTLYRKVLWSEY